MIDAAHYYSNILHFYSIAIPNYLEGPFLDPTIGNLIRVYQKTPEYAKMVFEMINFGQKLSSVIGGKSIILVSAIVGGIKKPLSEKDCKFFLRDVNKQIEYTEKTLDICLKHLEENWEIINKLGNVPTYHIGFTKNGIHDIYEGNVRIIAPDGKKVDYNILDFFSSLDVHNSKNNESMHLYYKPAGYPDGIYRSNSLSRINVTTKMATDLAEDAFKKFKEKLGSISNHTYAYPWVRIIEAIESIEIIKNLLEDPDIVNPECKTLDVEPKGEFGIGACEAPEGLLVYRIWSDFDGVCEKISILNATTQNVASTEKILSKTAKDIFNEKVLENLNLECFLREL